MPPPWEQVPQRGFLCIGGPLDGQWIDGAGAAIYHRNPKQDPFLLLQPSLRGLETPVPEIVDIRYKRLRVTLDGRSADVLLVEGFDPGDLLIRLLEGYRSDGP